MRGAHCSLLRLLLTLMAFVLAFSAQAANYVVNNTGSQADASTADGFCDTNPAAGNQNVCTLRAASEQGNAVTGPHNITFSNSITALTLTSGLPTITAKVTINGANASAVGGRVDINGGNLSGSFSFAETSTVPNPNGARGSTIKNLVIRNFNDNGIELSGHGYTVDNCYIGVTPTGEAASRNTGDGLSISGNTPRPLSVPTLPGGFNFDPAQIAAQLITIFSSIPPNTISNNVISGNNGDGIEIFAQVTALNIVTLNKIGTDKDGTDAIPNGNAGGGQHAGVRINSNAYANVIGPFNIISGNNKIDTDDGVEVGAGTVLFPNFIAGNSIGIGASPTADVGNGGSGIVTNTSPEQDGTLPDNPTNYSLFITGNVISDNKGANNNVDLDNGNGPNAGVSITGTSRRVKVFGNFIGLGKFGATPELSLDYGNAGEGIFISTADHEIGGSSAADFNVISGNQRHGILVTGSGTHSVLIRNNFIGVPDPTMLGVLNLGNAGDGIQIYSASSNRIGGPGSLDDNVIAGNGRNGIALRNGALNNGWSNLITRNQIYGNTQGGTGIGIDLEHDLNISDTQPDPAGDDPNTAYANYGQNQPIVCTGGGTPAACTGAPPPLDNGISTTLQWTLDTRPNATIAIEFFSTTATSQTYLGSQTITTGANGLPNSPGCTATGRCTSTVGAGIPTLGNAILLTATDITSLPDIPPIGVGGAGPANNTSEFSLPVTVRQAGELQFSAATYTVTEAGPTATITVQRVNGDGGAVSVDYASSDGTAVQPGDYGATAGTLTWGDQDTAPKTFSVPIVNDTVDESDETVDLALSNPTGGAALGTPNTAALTIQDNDSAALTVGDISHNEGNSGNVNFTFTVTLSNPSVNTVTVNYATANGTASAASDYTATSSVLTFIAGQTSKTISVTVHGDTMVEANETFTVNLSGAVGATIADAQGLGTIINDDGATLTINNVSQAEGNSGSSSFVFTVTLTNPSISDVTVNYATANDTATAGSDYTAKSGALTFTPGQTSKTIPVAVLGDTVVETNETFTLNLSGAVGATIADAQGIGTITNDDSTALAINNVSQAEGNSGTSSFVFTVTLTHPSASTVTVNYATANGTATAGSDYTAKSGTLTFTPGQTSKPITVSVTGDVVFEASETFTVNLSGAVGATIADAQGAGTISNDDIAPGNTIFQNGFE
ncbi:MAG: Calx-beta domain-containing protein [Gammaproteobacteria bacterium]